MFKFLDNFFNLISPFDDDELMYEMKGFPTSCCKCFKSFIITERLGWIIIRCPDYKGYEWFGHEFFRWKRKD